MEQGNQEFHRKYVLVPADKTANNIVVVCRLHYINTLKQELNGTKAYKETSTDEKTVVNSHSNDMPYKFAVNVKERQDKLPTMYWLHKLHKRPYKARFVANSYKIIFLFLDGDVPRRPSYGVYISQLIRFVRVCSHVEDNN